MRTDPLRRLSIGLQLIGWRLLLPILRRAVRVERLVALLAKPRVRDRDLELERFAVRVAGRLWRQSEAPCLERSIALHRQLGAAGAAPELLLGIDGTHHGHAWVNVRGAAVLEPAPPELRYTVLVRYDAAGVPVG